MDPLNPTEPLLKLRRYTHQTGGMPWFLRAQHNKQLIEPGVEKLWKIGSAGIITSCSIFEDNTSLWKNMFAWGYHSGHNLILNPLFSLVINHPIIIPCSNFEDNAYLWNWQRFVRVSSTVWFVFLKVSSLRSSHCKSRLVHIAFPAMAIKIIPNELSTISLYINQSTRDNRGILYIFFSWLNYSSGPQQWKMGL